VGIGQCSSESVSKEQQTYEEMKDIHMLLANATSPSIRRHNMDQTATFMQEATEFFVQENLARFLRGEELLNPVDRVAGY
jgi:hypothetical protein